MNPYDYPAEVWRLFNETPRAGTLDGAGVVCVRVEAAAQQALLELYVRVEDQHIGAARFRALGCPTTIAVGAWLATAVDGRPIAGLPGLDATAIRAALDIGSERTHCALLGEDLIRRLHEKLQ